MSLYGRFFGHHSVKIVLEEPFSSEISLGLPLCKWLFVRLSPFAFTDFARRSDTFDGSTFQCFQKVSGSPLH